MHRHFNGLTQFGDRGGVDKGFSTTPLSGIDYPLLNNIDDFELNALHDRIQ